MKQFSPAILVAIFALVLSSCSGMKNLLKAPVVGLTQDPEFTWQSASDGKFVVGGVVSQSDSMDQNSSTRTAGLLFSSLQDKRKDLVTQPLSAILNTNTQENHNQMLSEYKTTTGVGTQQLEKIDSLTDNRYIILASIQSNTIEKSRKENEAKKIVSEITRKIAVTFHVYDLQKKSVAWSGTITQKDTKNTEYEKKADDGAIITIVKVIADAQDTEDTKYPYPQVPETDDVLIKVFKGFAGRMPEKK